MLHAETSVKNEFEWNAGGFIVLEEEADDASSTRVPEFRLPFHGGDGCFFD